MCLCETIVALLSFTLINWWTLLVYGLIMIIVGLTISRLTVEEKNLITYQIFSWMFFFGAILVIIWWLWLIYTIIKNYIFLPIVQSI